MGQIMARPPTPSNQPKKSLCGRTPPNYFEEVAALGTSDKSLRSPLKVAIIPYFRGIVVQVRIFGLEMPLLPFSYEICLLERAFLLFSAIFNTPLFMFPGTDSLRLGFNLIAGIKNRCQYL